MSYFPMFIELKGEDCLVVGGGLVALRKVKVLLDFGAAVTVIAPEIRQEIQDLAQESEAGLARTSNTHLEIKQRKFCAEDVEARCLVVAATGSEEVNREISRLCKEKKIPINAVDQPKDCTFIFPSYVKEGEVVGAFSSGGQSPVITQYLKEKNKSLVTEELGNIAECLGSIREQVKMQVDTEEARKRVYQDILALALSEENVPTKERILGIINAYSKREMKAQERD